MRAGDECKLVLAPEQYDQTDKFGHSVNKCATAIKRNLHAT